MIQPRTPRFNLPYLDPSQAQPEVKINEAWNIIDEHLGDSGVDPGSGGSGSITVEEHGSPHTVVTDITTVRFVNATVESETGGVAVVTVPESGVGPDGPTGATGGQQFGAYWVALAGGAITLPINAVERVMNVSGTIKEILVLTKGGTGNCTIKIWKAAFSSHYPPVVTDDITGGANVVISSGTTHDDSTLSGFTTSFAQGDVYLLTLSSVAGFTSVGIFLRI